MAVAVKAPRRLPQAPDLRAHLTALPPLLAVVVFVVLGAAEGGFKPTAFYPAALFLLALLVVSCVAIPPPRPRRAAGIAIGLLAAYAAWSWLSVTWAGSTGTAVEGANRSVFAAIAFALFALWPMRGRQGAFILGAFALGIAGVGLVELLRVNADATPVDFFFRGRLAEPVGYVNANVALWSLALIPCLVFAARREVHPLLRGLFLSSAGVLTGLSLLGQSRGWFFVLPLVVVAVVALVPGRSRVLVALAALGVGLIGMAGPALDVFHAEGAAPIDGLFADATRAILIVSAGLFVVGTAAGLIDRHMRVGEPTAQLASRVVLGGAGALAVAGTVVLIAVAGSPVEGAKDKWEEFKQGGSTPDSLEGTRFTSELATHRYDFWTVAWSNFERAPIVGIGVDNFQKDYLRRGDSRETPRYPHSLELRVLSQTGIIGALLLFGSIAAAFVALAPALRRRRGLAGAAAGAATVSFAYWVLHGSVDWLWEFPGLTGPAFALLGLAVAVAAAGPGGEAAPLLSPGRGRLVAAGAGIGLASACAFAFLLPWLAERDTEKAINTWVRSPGAAFDRLDRASDLNRLSAKPAIVAGTIAVTIDSLDVAEREFTGALEREPEDSYSLLMLGAIASERGDQAQAQDLLRRAVSAAPNNEVAREALSAASKGRRVDAIRIAARLSAATRARVARALQD